MKVAAVQFCPQFLDYKGNLRSMCNLVSQAAKAGAGLVVLPELATSGYSMMSPEEAEKAAEVITDFDPSKKSFSSMGVFYSLASRLNVHIVWGLVEKDRGTGKLFNAQVMMCPDGSFESMRKVNQFGNDWLWSTPGRANPPIRKITIDGRGLKVGLLICKDVRDKKDDNWNSFYEKGDADVVALSASWGRGAFPATAWMDFAKNNGVILVVSNRYGKEANNDFGDGGVCVVYPDARVECKGLLWSQDCMVFGEV